MTALKIVTYNLRCLYNSEYDGMNSFIHRAALMLDKINEERPDVICFQEASDEIRAFLKRYLVDYDTVGHGRLADYSGEGLCISYRRDTMELFALEQFWLSETPHVPASRYEDQSEYPRICPHALIKHKDMKYPLRFFNIHLDHISDEARALGMRQILERATEADSELSVPTFILGDFNALPDSLPIKMCNEYIPYPIADITSHIDETFHDFGRLGREAGAELWKIDYIFITEKLADKVTRVYRWEEKSNGIYLSDHYPIACEITLDDEM